jgi:hypothetical protein
MPSVSGDTTACGSPVPSVMNLPGAPTSSSSSSSLPPRPAPPPPRTDFFSRLRPAPSRPALPVQSQTQPSVLRWQAIVVSFPVLSLAPPAPFTISEPGLLGKKVSRIYELIDPQYGYSAHNSTLSFRNMTLNNEQTFSDYGVTTGSIVQLEQEMRIAKPVIYLYPPSSLADVTVDLALTSSCRFSAVYPPPRTTIPPGELHKALALTWTVKAEPNGTLVDKTSGVEVSYLYWEAT